MIFSYLDELKAYIQYIIWRVRRDIACKQVLKNLEYMFAMEKSKHNIMDVHKGIVK